MDPDTMGGLWESARGDHRSHNSSDADSTPTIERTLELGVTHINTAEIYGPYANEELVGRALKGRRDEVVVATKFDMVSGSAAGPGVFNSNPANIRTAVEGSLRRQGTDRIDLYHQPRESRPAGVASFEERLRALGYGPRCRMRSAL
jgi:aryl-alcohol dehydrogenase-like predicted oxidoreductase